MNKRKYKQLMKLLGTTVFLVLLCLVLFFWKYITMTVGCAVLIVLMLYAVMNINVK